MKRSRTELGAWVHCRLSSVSSSQARVSETKASCSAFPRASLGGSDEVPATAAIRLANELDAELKATIPADKRVMLVLSAPIVDYRKTKAALATEILSFVNQHPGPVRAEHKTLIQGNEIEICLYESIGAEMKRITGLITNRASSPDILRNVSHILEDRISVKAEKCKKLSGPIWLAMLNDYFLTEPDTYRHALKSIAIEHQFERLLLVGGDGSVEVLF